MIATETLAFQASPALQARINEALHYLRTADIASLPTGRIEINGKEMFAVVQRYHTAPQQAQRFENHRRYLDLQYLVRGEEAIYVSRRRWTGAAVTEYDEAGDIQFYQEPSCVPSRLHLAAGDYAVFGPDDCHKTQCDAAPGGAEVCKVIVKIKIQEGYHV